MKPTAAIMLLLAVLLCACAVAAPEETAQTISTTAPATVPATEPLAVETTTAETQSPSTVPTQPPTAAEQILSSMTTEEKVGQLFLARCPAENAAVDAASYHLGGYILFGRDFEYETPDSVRANIASYQDAAQIPMLIAVDEEGGTVNRVSCFSQYRDERFYSPRYLYSQGGLELIETMEAEKCALLASLGINVNMAPVCDITTDEGSFMYYRSLGESPEVTGNFAASVVSVMAEYKIGSVLKHFPGYGDNVDTHSGIARDSRSLNALESADLIPFAAGMEAGCGAVLVSHTIVECLDAEYPASLSPAVHQYLRQEMGYGGVIVTDDLVMDAISEQYGDGEAAVLAVLAGNDLLCSSNYAEQYQAVLDAVEDGRISADLLDAAVLRVLNWKAELGLLG